METQKIKHKLVNQDHQGWVWHKEFDFDMVRVYRDKEGDVTNEVPFTQLRHLISLRDQAIWFTPQEWADLLNLMWRIRNESSFI